MHKSLCEITSAHLIFTTVSNHQVWETLAMRLELEKQASQRHGGTPDLLDGIDRIPDTRDELTYNFFMEIHAYLDKVSVFTFLLLDVLIWFCLPVVCGVML